MPNGSWRAFWSHLFPEHHQLSIHCQKAPVVVKMISPKFSFPIETIKCFWRLGETGSKIQKEFNSAYRSFKKILICSQMLCPWAIPPTFLEVSHSNLYSHKIIAASAPPLRGATITPTGLSAQNSHLPPPPGLVHRSGHGLPPRAGGAEAADAQGPSHRPGLATSSSLSSPTPGSGSPAHIIYSRPIIFTCPLPSFSLFALLLCATCLPLSLFSEAMTLLPPAPL